MRTRLRFYAAVMLAAGTLTLTSAPATAVPPPPDEAVHAMQRDAAAAQRSMAARRDVQQAASRGGWGRWHDAGPLAWRGVPRWIRDVGFCIRLHESFTAGHYRAQNPYSSASGAYQMLTSTYRYLADRADVPFRGAAAYAPAVEQDRMFIWAARHGQLGHWNGTGCPGT